MLVKQLFFKMTDVFWHEIVKFVDVILSTLELIFKCLAYFPLIWTSKLCKYDERYIYSNVHHIYIIYSFKLYVCKHWNNKTVNRKLTISVALNSLSKLGNIRRLFF